MSNTHSSSIAPRPLGHAIVFLRLFRANQSFTDIILDSRDSAMAEKQAIAILRRKHQDYYKVQLLGLLPSGTIVPQVGFSLMFQDAIPFYVKWEDDAGQSHEARYVNKAAAFAAYQDLQRQDILVLSTNSHPNKFRK